MLKFFPNCNLVFDVLNAHLQDDVLGDGAFCQFALFENNTFEVVDEDTGLWTIDGTMAAKEVSFKTYKDSICFVYHSLAISLPPYCTCIGRCIR